MTFDGQKIPEMSRTAPVVTIATQAAGTVTQPTRATFRIDSVKVYVQVLTLSKMQMKIIKVVIKVSNFFQYKPKLIGSTPHTS